MHFVNWIAMEDHAPDTPTAAPVADDISRRLREQRRRWDEYVHGHRKGLGQLETQLTQQLETLAVQLAEAQAGSHQFRTDLEHRSSELERRAGELHERSDQLDRRQAQLEGRAGEIAAQQAEWHEKQDELTRRTALLDEQSTALEQLSAELERRATESDAKIAAAVASDAGQSELISGLQAELTELRHRLQDSEAARSTTEQERQTIQAAAAAVASEVESLRATVELAQSETANVRAELAALQRGLEAKQAEIEKGREDLGSARADAEAARVDLEAARNEVQATTRAELEAARSEVESIRDECDRLKSQPAVPAIDPAELERLRTERDQFKQRLADAQTKLTEAQYKLVADGQHASEVEDLQRRFELAIQDVRDLKAQNAELEEKLSRARREVLTGTTPGGGNNFDWESQKRKMLASLEDDFDQNDEEDQKERQTIEDTVRITDQVVAQKDSEIAELRQLLENQTASIGQVAVGAAAVAAVLDQDELIAQERRRLVELENEWREKLRAAEVEISVERAKIARERLTVQDDRAAVEEQKKKLGASDGVSGGQDAGKKPGRQWLRRLGIRETDGNR